MVRKGNSSQAYLRTYKGLLSSDKHQRPLLVTKYVHSRVTLCTNRLYSLSKGKRSADVKRKMVRAPRAKFSYSVNRRESTALTHALGEKD